MAPIPLAIIGLSASAKTAWAADGHLKYLLSPRGKELYNIVGLLNSSKASGESAIKHFELPASVKAYASPEELASDPNVKLVICATRVDLHYATIAPSIAAGKDIFVEWPLAENKTRAAELAELAHKHKIRTIVGLQARVSPVVLKVRELLEQDAIGKVLSSEVRAYTSLLPRAAFPEGLAYFADRKVGGNPITIAVAHMIDFVHFALGEYTSAGSHSQIQRPDIQILDLEKGTSRPYKSDVPDLFSVHGSLAPGPFIAPGASLLVSYRTGPGFSKSMPFVWTINGERGEIRITSERGPFLQSESADAPILIEVEDHASGNVKQVDWTWQNWQECLPPRGRNVSALYDLYAHGAPSGFATFDDAVARHKEIDGYLEDFAKSQQV